MSEYEVEGIARCARTCYYCRSVSDQLHFPEERLPGLA